MGLSSLKQEGGKFLIWSLEENNFVRCGRGRNSIFSIFPWDLEGVRCMGFTTFHATCMDVKKDQTVWLHEQKYDS